MVERKTRVVLWFYMIKKLKVNRLSLIQQANIVIQCLTLTHSPGQKFRIFPGLFKDP